jgi:uncharacterized RDD family membrane protein YckC
MENDIKFVQASALRRLLARAVDAGIFLFISTLTTVVASMYIRLGVGTNIWTSIGAIFVIYMIFNRVLAFVFEAIWYWCFGLTPGKRLFGLTVVDIEGKPLSAKQYASRLFNIVFSAYALFLPFLTPLFLIKQGLYASEKGATTYDEGKYQVLFDGWSVGKRDLAIFFYILCTLSVAVFYLNIFFQAVTTFRSV